MLNAEDLVECPWCHEGMVVNPLPGRSDVCLYCGGFGYTLQYVRCNCGKQVNLTQEIAKGVYYCGNAKCEAALIKQFKMEVEEDAVATMGNRHHLRGFESYT